MEEIQMKKFNEIFSSRSHKKTAETVYDNHVDEIMHHLKRLHELTHKSSQLHVAGQKIGQDTSKFHQLHGAILNASKNL